MMVWDIVRRALDVREANAARGRAEEAHRRVLARLVAAERERSQDDGRSARYRAAWLSARRRADNYAGSVAYWKQTAAGLEESRKKLAQSLDEEQQRRKVSMGDLVPSPPGVVDALGSHDRRNVLRLSDENDRLRLVNEDVRRANARLAVRCADLEARLEKQLEGNPS